MLKKSALAALLMAPAMASAQPYLIVGVGTGSTDMEWIENVFAPGYETDDDLKRAVIGFGVKANEYIAVEGVYLSKAEGKVSGFIIDPVTLTPVPTTIEVEHQGVQMALLASAPLSPQFSLYGKLSANLLAIDMTTDMFGTTVIDDSETALYLGAGVGAQVQFNDKVGMRLGVERTMVNEYADYSDGDFDIDQATLALQFSF